MEDDSGAAAFSCVISCVLLRLRLHRVMNSGRIVPSMSRRDSIFVLHHFYLDSATVASHSAVQLESQSF